MQLHYSLWKPQNSLPSANLVFLHGMGGTGALWRPIAASLEDSMAILAPDQRGHGRSQIPHVPASREPARYTPLDYGRDVVELIDALNFKPCFLVGHSMGVRTACAAAHLMTSPSLRGLILIDLGFSGPAGGGLGQGLYDFLQILPMEFETREAARAFMNERCPDPSIAQYLMAVSVVGADRRLLFPFDKAALLETLNAARDASVRKWVRDLGARGLPILVLRGAKSLVWKREEFEAERAAFGDLPSVVFEEFPETGHGLPFERRVEFVERVKRFVSEAK